MSEVKVGWRKTTDQEREAFTFLNDLRESGATNMFAATPYLERELGHSKAEATALLITWMDVFNKEGDYETIPETQV
tara:strand:+ start:164 stop:394 length:231 start_codon:yes stop_codon:yes gene_type:complete